MKPFNTVTSRIAPLMQDNIDTDQIIPARFLKVTGKEGLGEHLFEDLRRRPDGSPVGDFVLNRPDLHGAAILLAGKNFGCGSSREHAPWALVDHGFRVVLGQSFGDIFYANALKNGLLPVVVSADAVAAMAEAAADGRDVTVDLPGRVVRWAGGSFPFEMDKFAAVCLQEGLDQLGYILRFEGRIVAYEARHQRTGA